MMYKLVIFFFIFSIYFGHLDTGITPFLISKIGTVLLILTAIITNFRDYFNFSRLTKILLLLILLTSVRNYYFFSTEISLINIESLLVIFSIESIKTLIINNKIDFNIIINYTIFFSVLAGLYLVFGFGDGSWEGRYTIDNQNQNLLAVNLSIGIIFIIIKLIKSKRKLLLFSCLFIILVAVTMTGSRSGFIVCILGALSVLYKYRLSIHKTKRIFYSFFFIMFLVSLGLIFTETDNILALRFQNNSGIDLSGRDEYWKIMPFWVADNWLFGIGETGLYSKSMSNFGAARSPHNLYVKTFVQTGLIGLLIISILIRELFKLKKISKNNLLSLTGILVFLALSLVAHPLTTMSMWLLFIPSIVLTKINKKKKFNEL